MKIAMPKGYRKLRSNEILKRGDRFLTTKGEWRSTRYAGEAQSKDVTPAPIYIRKK